MFLRLTDFQNDLPTCINFNHVNNFFPHNDRTRILFNMKSPYFEDDDYAYMDVKEPYEIIMMKLNKEI